MSALKLAKSALLGTLRHSGASAHLSNSSWRRRRLLILCYHGIALDEEHRWNPGLYVSAATFEQRLMALRDGGYVVLPLTEALARMDERTLPDKAVSLTFDDGFHDFSAIAHPLLRRYGMPATVYLTSYYSLHRQPVFDVMLSYLLWKGRRDTLDLARFGGDRRLVRLADDKERQQVAEYLRFSARTQGLSADAKDELLQNLAKHLRVDYAALLDRRLLQIMSAEQVAQLDSDLVDVQLHTHRHRVPLQKALFEREIQQNRSFVREVTSGRSSTSHFCYPSGVTSPSFLPWLHDLGIVSATTCRQGLASRKDDALMLPRLLDAEGLTPALFDAWLTGAASLVPRRPFMGPSPTSDGILAEATAKA